MDLIEETEKINRQRLFYEKLIRDNINEKYIRKLIDNKIISDIIYQKLEAINVYNDYDPNRKGKYTVTLNSNHTYHKDVLLIEGFTTDPLTGKQTNQKLSNYFEMNIFDFLDSINTNFYKDEV